MGGNTQRGSKWIYPLGIRKETARTRQSQAKDQIELLSTLAARNRLCSLERTTACLPYRQRDRCNVSRLAGRYLRRRGESGRRCVNKANGGKGEQVPFYYNFFGTLNTSLPRGCMQQPGWDLSQVIQKNNPCSEGLCTAYKQEYASYWMR